MDQLDLYQTRESDFYDKQAVSPNPLRAWFHTFRHDAVNKLVTEYYNPGDVIVDVGCGNCVWNINKLPVIGVDPSPDLIAEAFRQERLNRVIISDATDIPLDDECADVAVAAEVIEHVPGIDKVLSEIRRILKKNGTLILTVPYDTLISAWRPLFWLQCSLQGRVFGDEYYKQKCGHIHRFSPRAVRSLLAHHHFSVIRQFTNFRFTLFTVARKA